MPFATPAPPEPDFAAVFALAPVAMALFGPDLRVVQVNSRFSALIGRPAGDLIGHSASACLPAPIVTGLDAAIQSLSAGDALPPLTWTPTSHAPPVIAEWRAVRDVAGEVTHVLCTLQAAPGRETRGLNEPLLAYLDACPLPAWIVDAEGRLVYSSPSHRRLVPTARAGALVRDLFPADVAEEHMRNSAGVIAAGASREAIETVVLPDGGFGKFFVAKFPLEGTDGATLVGGVAVDVTELVAAQRSAMESESRFGAIFDNAAVGIAQVGADGVLVRINRRLAEILGYGPEELLGRTFSDVTHPDDLAGNLAFTEQIRAGKIDEFSMEKRYLRKDGSFVWTNLSVRCIRDPAGAVAYYVSVVEDISERKRAQERVQLLIAEVNHRAKNMLAVVQSIARQTARAEPGAFIDSFSRRVQSLARAQDLFIANAWGPVSLRDAVITQLAPFGEIDGARIAVAGPDIDIRPSAAQSIAMAVHELAAAASATGALSVPHGRVAIAWSVGADGRLLVAWREFGGARPENGAAADFATKVAVDMVQFTLRADVTAGPTPDGYAWTLSAPPDVVVAAEARLTPA